MKRTNKTMLRLCVVLIIALIICCAIAYACITPELPVLSKELQEEMENAWFETKGGHPLGTWGPELRYYGSYSGVSVLFMGGALFSSETKRIALSSFWYQNSFMLWAYVDGTFMSLEEAYKTNKIGLIDIATIAKIHRAYHDVYFGHMPYGDQ